MTVEQLTPEELRLARATYAPGSQDNEWALYLADCRRYGITPLDKKLHFQVRKNRKQDGTTERKYAPVVSIDYMREVAEHTGNYLSSGAPHYQFKDAASAGYPLSCQITVKKVVQGLVGDFVGAAHWSEFYPGEGAAGGMWRKMPFLMLAKCAEALALRKAFPGQLQGLYEKAEMEQADKPAPIARPKAA